MNSARNNKSSLFPDQEDQSVLKTNENFKKNDVSRRTFVLKKVNAESKIPIRGRVDKPVAANPESVANFHSSSDHFAENASENLSSGNETGIEKTKPVKYTIRKQLFVLKPPTDFPKPQIQVLPESKPSTSQNGFKMASKIIGMKNRGSSCKTNEELLTKSKLNTKTLNKSKKQSNDKTISKQKPFGISTKNESQSTGIAAGNELVTNGKDPTEKQSKIKTTDKSVGNKGAVKKTRYANDRSKLSNSRTTTGFEAENKTQSKVDIQNPVKSTSSQSQCEVQGPQENDVSSGSDAAASQKSSRIQKTNNVQASCSSRALSKKSHKMQGNDIQCEDPCNAAIDCESKSESENFSELSSDQNIEGTSAVHEMSESSGEVALRRSARLQKKNMPKQNENVCAPGTKISKYISKFKNLKIGSSEKNRPKDKPEDRKLPLKIPSIGVSQQLLEPLSETNDSNSSLTNGISVQFKESSFAAKTNESTVSILDVAGIASMSLNETFVVSSPTFDFLNSNQPIQPQE